MTAPAFRVTADEPPEKPGGMYGPEHRLDSTIVESRSLPLPDAPRPADDAGAEDGPGRPGASSSGATNSARTPDDCPNCAALRHAQRLLCDASLYLIDRNAALSAENARLLARLAEGGR